MKLRSLRALFLAFVCFFSFPAFATSVDINTASAEQLAQSLKGVGPAKAESIVAYRETHGPFQSVDQLVEVKGIGASTVNKNRELIMVGSPTPNKAKQE